MRRQPAPPSDDQAHELLQTLITAPPARRAGLTRPVALRSTTEQRRHALSGYLLRSWVDRVLRHVELTLVVVLVLGSGAWLLDGPVRDWWYLRNVTAQVAVAADPPVAVIPPATAVIATVPLAPLPYVTDAMNEPLAPAEFIAPRAAVPEQPVELPPEPSRLTIPTIGLDTAIREVFVVDGIWEVADYAAGYLHGSGLPGEPGNMALAGHAGLRGAVFRDLGALQPGDDIFVDAAGWRYTYRVRESHNVWPTQVEVLQASDIPILTLITCTNWDTQRLIVVAGLIGATPITGE
ncbi:MAG TPA: sortase [Roseiflexaceae bacterium]|nr:sortase [Roseiflexaceae bacterium]